MATVTSPKGLPKANTVVTTTVTQTRIHLEDEHHRFTRDRNMCFWTSAGDSFYIPSRMVYETDTEWILTIPEDWQIRIYSTFFKNTEETSVFLIVTGAEELLKQFDSPLKDWDSLLDNEEWKAEQEALEDEEDEVEDFEDEDEE